MKNIVFMGTPDFAAQILEHIEKNCLELQARIVGVYCQPDKPAGRGKKLQSPPVKLKAQELNLPVFQPLNFKNQEDVDALAALEPDVLIVAAYGLILPESVLSIPKLGPYNIHASLLPQWRGAAPIHRGILAGDTQTGITIMRMEKGLDTGDMLLQQAIPIAKKETSQTLFDALADLGGKLMMAALKQVFELRAGFIPQNHEKATYAHKILKEEFTFDWNISAVDVDRKVRALMTPRTILSTKKDNELNVQILEGEVVDYSKDVNIAAGTILEVTPESLIIATTDLDKAYAVKTIKPIGKNAMKIKDFANGYL